jgi:Peptidase family M23
VFPVYGGASFSDDFAAPRADTIWHHGNDIFAPLGAPVLAVTDGQLFLVGWNTLGGHRLWLRDGQGHEYYYAHLSAYSPLAVNGGFVQAGDVIGFVGESGVAGGVPHLHFEIHPSALLGLGYDGVINPYAYLLAWQARQDREFSVTLPTEAGGRAPEPGAVLLETEDISTASGLDYAAIGRALAFPAAGGVEEAGLLTPMPPDLVGAPIGFPGS